MNLADKRLLIHLSLIVIVILLIPVVIILSHGDGPTPDDSDLMRPALAIDDQKNAWFLIKAYHLAAEEARDEYQRIFPMGLEDADLFIPDGTQWLARWKNDAEAITDILLNYPFVTQWRGDIDAPLSAMVITRFISEFYTLKVRQQIESGEIDSAWRQVNIFPKIQTNLASHDNFALQALVGCILSSEACSLTFQLLHHAQPRHAPEIRELIQALSQVPTIAEICDRMLAGEYRYGLVSIAEGNKDLLFPQVRWAPFASELLFKRNTTLAQYGDQLQSIRDAAGKTWADFELKSRMTRPADIVSHYDLVAGAINHGNVYGMILLASILPTYDHVIHRLYRDELHRQQLMALLGLQLYIWENDQPPLSLDELVPDYLPSIPTNPFTLNPLEYDPVLHTIDASGVNSPSFPYRANSSPFEPDTAPSVSFEFMLPTE